MTPLGFLDELYKRYGYHLEETKNVYLDGATGSEKISKIMESLEKAHLLNWVHWKSKRLLIFLNRTFWTKRVNRFKENFLIMQMNQGFRAAIRPSGTEPKLKFYIFGEGSPNPQNLSEEKAKCMKYAMKFWVPKGGSGSKKQLSLFRQEKWRGFPNVSPTFLKSLQLVHHQTVHDHS